MAGRSHTSYARVFMTNLRHGYHRKVQHRMPVDRGAECSEGVGD